MPVERGEPSFAGIIRTADLTEAAFRALLRAGWTPDREIDVEEALYEADCSGFLVFDAARQFLRSLDGISFTCTATFGPTIDMVCRIAATEARLLDDVGFRQWEAELGHRLCPVGRFLPHGGDRLLLSEDGQLVVAAIDTLVLAGRTPAEGLNALLAGKPL